MWTMMALLACGGQRAEIERLQAENAALQARVDELEDQPTPEDARQARLDALQEHLEQRRAERAAQRAQRSDVPDQPALTPATLQALLDDPEELSKLGRVVPHTGPDGDFDGLRISAIRRGSAPDQLGLRNGDVLHTLDGHPLRSMQEAMAAYNAVKSGGPTWTVELTRRGERQTLVLDPGQPVGVEDDRPPSEDVDLETLSGMGRFLLHRGPDGSFDGYRLSAVKNGSPLDELGLQNGDVIHSVEGFDLRSMTDAMEAYTTLGTDLPSYTLEITRDGERRTVVLDLGRLADPGRPE
jgi:type II secretory pathway component PulC